MSMRTMRELRPAFVLLEDVTVVLVPAAKTGRAANGLSLGRGNVIHLVDVDIVPKYDHGYLHDGWKPALCGNTPGKKRGNGWGHMGGSEVTCEKCLRKAAELSKVIANA